MHLDKPTNIAYVYLNIKSIRNKFSLMMELRSDYIIAIHVTNEIILAQSKFQFVVEVYHEPIHGGIF